MPTAPTRHAGLRERDPLGTLPSVAEKGAGGPAAVPDRIVILDPEQAQAVIALLGSLQALLRFGHLGVEQLRLLVDGELAAGPGPDPEQISELVGHALDPIRRQLGT